MYNYPFRERLSSIYRAFLFQFHDFSILVCCLTVHPQKLRPALFTSLIPQDQLRELSPFRYLALCSLSITLYPSPPSLPLSRSAL